MSLFATARSTVGVVTRHNDINIVFLLVVVIALMIIPLPTPLVDTLIGANMALSFIMLMMTMYVRTVLDFSVFPTMLLFTTLFRVGLNITTTRLILLQADAGEIIYTFGEFALGGNFVVGAVVFLILTIVQFLVIAKGAERVAEVGARFTLDAMPGKQMSIDADMRAGVIDMEEAQRRRERINQESQMYGAMDGAMKFVKGDSIAGMIIAVVNIVGGTIIGVTQNGMTAGEALHTYGILTIGDGLVSQIPSLLVSISAGILITRGGDSDDNIGAQIGFQIFNQPKALLMAGGLVFLFALIPGFPKPQLFTLAALLGGLGYMLKRIKETPEAPDAKEELAKSLTPTARPKPRPGAAGARDEFAPTVPIILDISEDMGASLDYHSLNDELANLRRALYFDLGVPFPGINIRPHPGLPELSYVLNVNEIPISRGKLEKDMVLARDSGDNLALLGVEFKKGERFLPDVDPLWVPGTKAAMLERAGISVMSHPRILAYHLSLVLARHASSFLGMQETKYLLDKMEERAPDLVREATRLLPTQRIAEIFQRLVQEQVSIRDLRSILEALIEWSPKEKDTVMLTEYVRSALKRQISYMYSKGQNMLPAILMDPSVEETIRKAIRQTSAGAFLALDPDTTQRFLRGVTQAAGDYQSNTQRPVLMASMDIRRYVRRLIEAEHYGLPVVSYQEVTPEISIQPVSRIRL
ncbi:MAG TPA: type III secretion system export apparatus subunit SctV [Candidatus Bilophila faecipullorum]|uniref:Type III secretion system export apparatus subunit SctV n=3 Tax=Bilophila TaxID=35832 RepID=A0A9D1QZS1_9BACT|nr:type III secretion system export apparatus subunit SctV [uncultured Bilophila sp.]HIW77873.1 type III secretion system export apparatus subunit SctV [Candidatus Bilophila faecipullorum]